MLVHSDEYLSATLEDVLATRGFEVSVYEDAYSAIDSGCRPDVLLFETRPDLVRDVALAETIRRVCRSIVGAVALSSRPVPARRDVFEHALIIPFRIDELVGTIRRIVDVPSRARAI